MNEILTPLSDTLYVSPWNIRFTTFRFGPMLVHFVLKDVAKLPPELMEQVGHIEDHRNELPFQFKQFIIFCIVNDDQAYILSQFTDEGEATKYMNNIIDTLKQGESLEIIDEAGIYERMQLSYRGINWIW